MKTIYLLESYSWKSFQYEDISGKSVIKEITHKINVVENYHHKQTRLSKELRDLLQQKEFEKSLKSPLKKRRKI